MAFLTLTDGTTTLQVSVRSNAAGQTYDYHGLDRQRMFDGTMREIRRGIFRKWSLTSTLKNQADYLALVALLTGPTLPLTASGDLTDGEEVFVHPALLSASPAQTAQGFLRPVVFELYETLNVASATAGPWLFLRSGAGWYKDLAKTMGAANLDHARVWADASGNARDVTTRHDGSDPAFTLIPQVQQSGTAVRFGDPAFTNGDVIGPTTRIGAYDVPLLGGFETGEVMVTFRRTSAPDSDTAGSVLFQLTAANDLSDLVNPADYVYKASDGHIWSTFGTRKNYDCGAPGIDLTGRFHVYNVSSSDTEWCARLDGAVLRRETTGLYPMFDGITPAIGEDNISRFFDGWVKHFVLFNFVLSTAQRASWYAFMNGDVSDPPLPP